MNVATQKDNHAPAEENASEARYLAPRVNIVERKNDYILEAEMPGVNKEGLEVLLEDNQLTLVGNKAEVGLDAQLIYRETSPRGYRRQFVLDPAIDTARIDAKMENGVLRLTLPKAERLKPRMIKVQ